jgi:hypothetical protein
MNWKPQRTKRIAIGRSRARSNIELMRTNIIKDSHRIAEIANKER